jgi:hypothetical protein
MMEDAKERESRPLRRVHPSTPCSPLLTVF